MSVTPVSPKVVAGAVSGVIAAAILANISLITPDLFTGLGKWSGLVYGLVITFAVSGAGWLKSDPLRNADQSKQEANQSAAALPPVTLDLAPAKTFPAAKVDAVIAAAPAVLAPETPAAVTPVFTAPAAVAEPSLAETTAAAPAA